MKWSFFLSGKRTSFAPCEAANFLECSFEVKGDRSGLYNRNPEAAWARGLVQVLFA